MDFPADQPTLLYLPLRARAEALRMMLHYARIPFHDVVIPLDDWPKIKPAMPQGPGAEFPGREKGNRALPVLRLVNGDMLPESRDIAAWIAAQAGHPLLPENELMAAEAHDFFAKSQSLPLFWPTAMLVRFPEQLAEKMMCGEDLGDAKFPDPKQTSIRDWYAAQPGWAQVRPMLLDLEQILETRQGPFFGGSQPHYGEIGVFVSVDALVSLFGREAALAGFGPKWQGWYDSVCALPAVEMYRQKRDSQQGYPNSIVMNHSNPTSRPMAHTTATKFHGMAKL